MVYSMRNSNKDGESTVRKSKENERFWKGWRRRRNRCRLPDRPSGCSCHGGHKPSIEGGHFYGRYLCLARVWPCYGRSILAIQPSARVRDKPEEDKHRRTVGTLPRLLLGTRGMDGTKEGTRKVSTNQLDCPNRSPTGFFSVSSMNKPFERFAAHYHS